MIGSPILRLVPPGRQTEEADILHRLRLGERIESYETQRVRKDGGIVDVSLTISPIRDAQGRIVGASKIARDIGARKIQERLRLEAEEALRQADRRKDQFLAVMAHELRNPLAPLVNGLQLLQLGGQTPEVQREMLDIAQRQVNTLVRLVDDLLDASRIAHGLIELRREPVRIGEVVAAAVEQSRPLVASRGQQLTVNVADEPLNVLGDRTRLVQVLANLLNNAAKFTGAGGRIGLEAIRDREWVLVRVSDSGVGLAPDSLTEIFEMFAQVNAPSGRRQDGLGIGLALARRLVELHGGTLEAHSEGLGKGCVFAVRLPLALGASTDTRAVMPKGIPAMRRVLVVDDNDDAARSIALLLRSLGQTVHVVHSGHEAIAYAETLRPDLILLDIGMPGLTGHDVVRRIRSESWGRKPLIVAITGWGQEEDRRRSREAGFDQHLVKPVMLDALYRLLMQAPSG